MKNPHDNTSCEHQWSIPVIVQQPIYNDFGVETDKTYPVAVVSCSKCGEFKKHIL